MAATSTCLSSIALIGTLLIAWPLPAAPQPAEVAYQGELKEHGTRFTGTAQMKFAIVKDGASLWSNDSTSVAGSEPSTSVDVTVANGVFTVYLGGGGMKPLSPAAFGTGAGSALRVWVKTTGPFQQLSDQPLASVPFALRSEEGASADGLWSPSGSNIYRAQGNVGIGTSTPGNKLDVIGGAAFQGNHLYLRNRSSPPDLQTWGLVVSGATGDLGLGPATDVPPSGGSLLRSVVRLDHSAPSLSLRIDDTGQTTIKVLQITGGSDLAERFDVSCDDDQLIVAGMVVTIDAQCPGGLRLAAEQYDSRVAGVISGGNDSAPGLIMRSEGTINDGKHPVALTGRVWCWVDASYGPVRTGDLLTTSATPGMAMCASDPTRRIGAILGKAMGPLEKGRGLVLILVSLQ